MWMLQRHESINAILFSATVEQKNLEICLLTFRGFPPTPCGKWNLSECISLLASLPSPNRPLSVQWASHARSAQACLWENLRCFLLTYRWPWSDAIIQIGLAPFDLFMNWCGIPMSELEPHCFWEMVLFLQNLCRLKIYII